MHLHFLFAAIYPMICEHFFHKLLTIRYYNENNMVVINMSNILRLTPSSHLGFLLPLIAGRSLHNKRT